MSLLSEFRPRDGHLYCEAVALEEIAEAVGTPVYCYSSAQIVANYKAFSQALAGLSATICFAVKANPNLAVIRCLARLGAGADVVSGGEMSRALAAGIPAAKIVFSGVGKTEEEMAAGLKAGIGQFNIESEDELETLADLAKRQGCCAPVALRLNPDIDAGTHEKISTGRAEDKFGISAAMVAHLYQRMATFESLEARGLAIHIGSQILNLDHFADAFGCLRRVCQSLRDQGLSVDTLDLGGGLGVADDHEGTADFIGYAAIVRREMGGLGTRLIFEPGRALLANAGVLIARVIRLKKGHNRDFLILDAGMNDLMRPALYNAHHHIVPLRDGLGGHNNHRVDVVGPICESADTFVKQDALPPLAAGDFVAISHVGAYGAAMASTYNLRPRIAEVLVHEDGYDVVRPRESVDDMLAKETIPAWLIPS